MGGCTRAVYGQRLGKHVPAATDTKTTAEELCFVFGPCRDVINSRLIVSSQFCIGVCKERTSGCKAEESPLLVAVARERLVKRQQAGKGLSGAMVICGLWRLAVAL
jgi:hypothetical protein